MVEVNNSCPEQAALLQDMALEEQRTRVSGDRLGVIQFRFSEDFTLTVQHSILGRGKWFVAGGRVGRRNYSKQFRFKLYAGSARLHNKFIFLIDHRRADIPLTTSKNLKLLFSMSNVMTAI